MQLYIHNRTLLLPYIEDQPCCWMGALCWMSLCFLNVESVKFWQLDYNNHNKAVKKVLQRIGGDGTLFLSWKGNLGHPLFPLMLGILLCKYVGNLPLFSSLTTVILLCIGLWTYKCWFVGICHVLVPIQVDALSWLANNLETILKLKHFSLMN